MIKKNKWKNKLSNKMNKLHKLRFNSKDSKRIITIMETFERKTHNN